ncbi:MAG: hypothetical protein ACON3Z_10990 [Bradymonadia bacterium]
MASIRFSNAPESSLAIPEVCLVGRHWSCYANLNMRSVPLFWVEIRWMGSSWAWRAINSAEETRGSGAMGSKGWRVLRPDPTRRPRISIGDESWFEFVDLSPPEAFARNVNTHDVVAGDALDDLWECFDGRIYRLGWEESDSAEIQHVDGDLVQGADGLYRVFCPRLSAPTVVAPLTISMGDCSLEIDLENLKATFETSHASVDVRGECVRVMAAYALPRRDEHYSDGGWLTSIESHSRWLQLGGNPKSKPDRIGHERGKLRTQLHKAGVLEVKKLFERRSSGANTTIRLGLAPENIFILGDELKDDYLPS